MRYDTRVGQDFIKRNLRTSRESHDARLSDIIGFEKDKSLGNELMNANGVGWGQQARDTLLLCSEIAAICSGEPWQTSAAGIG